MFGLNSAEISSHRITGKNRAPLKLRRFLLFRGHWIWSKGNSEGFEALEAINNARNALEWQRLLFSNKTVAVMKTASLAQVRRDDRPGPVRTPSVAPRTDPSEVPQAAHRVQPIRQMPHRHQPL